MSSAAEGVRGRKGAISPRSQEYPIDSTATLTLSASSLLERMAVPLFAMRLMLTLLMYGSSCKPFVIPELQLVQVIPPMWNSKR